MSLIRLVLLCAVISGTSVFFLSGCESKTAAANRIAAEKALPLKEAILVKGYLHRLDGRLSAVDLEPFTLKELRVVRNTIVAKYGHCFNSQDLAAHFAGFEWYSCKPDVDVPSMLNEVDKANIDIIAVKEQLLKNQDWISAKMNSVEKYFSRYDRIRAMQKKIKVIRTEARAPGFASDYIFSNKKNEKFPVYDGFEYMGKSISVSLSYDDVENEYTRCSEAMRSYDDESSDPSGFEICYPPTQYEFVVTVIDLHTSYDRKKLEKYLDETTQLSEKTERSEITGTLERKDGMYVLRYEATDSSWPDYIKPGQYIECVSFYKNYMILGWAEAYSSPIMLGPNPKTNDAANDGPLDFMEEMFPEIVKRVR